LKEFPNDKFSAFDKERSAFKALRKLDGVIQYIGSYQCSNSRAPVAAIPHETSMDMTVHSILLELGNCDFNVAMAGEAPPNLPNEIKQWWEELRGISSALVRIHRFEIDGTVYHG
jgi:hypothetical protein